MCVCRQRWKCETERQKKGRLQKSTEQRGLLEELSDYCGGYFGKFNVGFGI